jgi:metal-responsive CopG/Arc/MetJ family transcriptional regulator
LKKSEIAKLLRNREKTITIRINPELLKLVDETLKEDKEFRSRTELIENCFLKYLEERGKI